MSTKKFVFILSILSVLTSAIAVLICGIVFGFNPLEMIFGLNLKEINKAIEIEDYDEAERLYLEKLKGNYSIELVNGLTEVYEMKAIKKDLEEVDKLVKEESISKAFNIVREIKDNNEFQVLEYEIEDKYDELKEKKFENLKKEARETIDNKAFKGDRYTYYEGYYIKDLYKVYPNEAGSKEIIEEYVTERNEFFDAKEKAESEKRAAEQRAAEEKRKREAAEAAKKKAEQNIQNNSAWPIPLSKARTIAKASYPEFKLLRDGVKNENMYNSGTGHEGNAYNFLFHSDELKGKYVVWVFMDGSVMARVAHEP